MILTLVLCRFSLPFGKYFFKKVDRCQLPSSLDKGRLPLPDKPATAISARMWRCRLDFQKALNKAFASPGMIPVQNVCPLTTQICDATNRQLKRGHGIWRLELRRATSFELSVGSSQLPVVYNRPDLHRFFLGGAI